MNYLRHYYLYSKHWYRKSNFIDDIKTIHAVTFGLHPNQVRIKDIADILLQEVAGRIINHEGNREYFFWEFVNDLHPHNMWKYGSKNTDEFYVRIIKNCLSFMSIQKVNGLGDPDPNVLPLSD